MWAKWRDSVHKPQFLKRKESRSGSNRGPFAYLPSVQPIGQTGSHFNLSVLLFNGEVLVQRRTRDRKIVSSSPDRRGGRIFFFGVNFPCWPLFGIRSTFVLPQWHVKDPGPFAKSAGSRLHLNTYTPLTQRSGSELTILSSHSVGTYQGIELTRNSLWNAWPQSPQLVEPLWTDLGLKSEICVRELISA